MPQTPELIHAAHRERHHCPRCGYDVSGVVDSWTEQCPVEGICSECGLAYGWKYILNPDFHGDPLFVETATRRLMHAMVVTYRRTLLPWRFWSWVKLEYTFNPRRMVICVAACALVIWLLGSTTFLALNTATFYVHGPMAISRWGPWIYSLNDVLLFTLWPDVFSWGVPTLFAVQSGAFALWMALMPLTFLILGDTMARAKARWFHVVRIGVYQFSVLPIYWLLCLLEPQLEYWIQGIVMSAQVRQPQGSALIQVVMTTLGLIIFCCTVGAPVLWIVIWWGLASKRYLRIRHPWLVAFVMAFTSGLAVFTAWMYYALHTRLY